MTDSIAMPKTPKPSASGATATSGYLGVDLGEFQLGAEVCSESKGSGFHVRGVDFLLFPQCEGGNLSAPIINIPCGMQTKEGVTWKLDTETGEIETNCPGKKRKYLKDEMMTLTVSLNAIALNNSELMSLLQGRQTSPAGNMRIGGYGSLKRYIVALIDRESMTMAIYPDAQYVPESLEIKYAYDSEPSSEITFDISKVDLGDGQPFFYEVRSIATKG
jgi:hypothetical protein